jgi:hypothetical protein
VAKRNAGLLCAARTTRCNPPPIGIPVVRQRRKTKIDVTHRREFRPFKRILRKINLIGGGFYFLFNQLNSI